MAYYNPYIAGKYNPLNNPTNQGFDHCSFVKKIDKLDTFRKFLRGETNIRQKTSNKNHWAPTTYIKGVILPT